jgi:hypothetical protein
MKEKETGRESEGKGSLPIKGNICLIRGCWNMSTNSCGYLTTVILTTFAYHLLMQSSRCCNRIHREESAAVLDAKEEDGENVCVRNRRAAGRRECHSLGCRRSCPMSELKVSRSV